MKKLRTTSITSATSGEPSKLEESIDSLKDDFDYIIASLEKLDRTGATESNEGLIIAEGLSDTFQNVIAKIAEKLS